MRHYEIVFLIHPNHSDQAAAVIEHYKGIMTKGKGTVHRLEDWGRRVLAYPIKNLHKAHYVLMNIECDQATLDEIHSGFRYSDTILRFMIIKTDEAITEESVMMIELNKEQDEKKPSSKRDSNKRFEKKPTEEAQVKKQGENDE